MGSRGAFTKRCVPIHRAWDAITDVEAVYSVVLDPTRNQACSGSMDGTVRVWNLDTGQCVHTLTGHTSLVGLLGLSPSYLVSAAADSTLRVWDPDSGELRHTLQAHTGAITCFQHDEFKVLSGSDGTLKMWDIRDGTFVRDLLTNINGVWQVVFEGRWCVAASNRLESTVIDVWDFGREEGDEEWIGEPGGGIYDDSTDEEDDEADQADADAMDQDLELMPSPDTGDDDLEDSFIGGEGGRSTWRMGTPDRRPLGQPAGSAWVGAALGHGGVGLAARLEMMEQDKLHAGSSRNPRALLPMNEETPSRPRMRPASTRKR